ncbi:MAG: NADH-quinone oxidoreductase subunit NuoE [Rhizobiaceae bacterium]|nr:NADH-quinone oxidoreductase subunit NuoE [Hyphomicrobiales bacterium]NRB29654.1 NADH-quinone oxidoreductase subunit NuoE [Rhizobiaceae bacterium]
MSVRRLAEDSVQPASFAFNRSNAAWAKKKLKDYPKGREASAVIPLLMRAQEQDGWVTKAAIEHVAEMLDMPLIRVLEVATFYTQFQLAPVGKRAHIQVCGTTPCMLRGAEDLIKVCKKKISPNPFEVTEDGNLSWEEVECQGACVNAPMVMIFKDSYEDLTAEQMEEIIDKFAAGKGDEVMPGPQIDRIYSAPEGGLTSLTGKPVVAKKSAAKKAPAKAAAKKAAPATKAKPAAKIAGNIGKASAKPKAAPKAKAEDKGKPPAMRKPAKPDDLKLISGVGPKLEGVLNGLGIYKFEQISKWKKAEREWVDGYLKFKGRIDRDDWVKQAKALAKGGEEEYIRVFGKKPR